MHNRIKWAAAILIVFILISQLYILYFIKYSNQNLLFSNFNLFVTGNIINFVITFLLVTGVIIYLLRNSYYRPVITYTFITSILLLICFLSLYISIPESNIYFFEQPLNKFITGLFFILYLFVQVMFLSFVWLRIFTGKNLISLRVIFNSFIILILLLLTAYFFIEVKMKNYSEEWNYTGSNNSAVVLGAAVWSGNQPSPTLSSRIDKAIRLYKKNIVNKIMLTGSNAPGELTEAEVAYHYIINKGVDTSDIMLENQTTSTAEQIRFVRNNIIASGRFDNIFIISDKYHLARINEISRFYNLKVILVASGLELSFENKIYNRLRECIALSMFWCFAL